MDAITTAVLSPVQEAVLFECLLHGDQRYQIQIVLSFDVPLNPNRLRTALERVCAQHETLRTVINISDYEVPVQEIHSSGACVFECLTDSPDVDSAKQSAFACLDYTKAPVRLLLLLEKSRSRLVLTYHHIVMDGWSGSHFILSLLEHYQTTAKPKGLQVIPSFRDYQDFVDRQDHQAMYRFWKRYLEGFQGTLLDEKNSSGKGDRMEGSIRFFLRPEIVQEMKAFIKENHCTAACIFGAAWGLVLSDLHERDDVVFGFVFSGRHLPLPGIENILGVLFHCVPVRIKSGVPTSPEWLWSIQNMMLDIMENQFLPLSQIMDAASSASIPLYDTVLAIENYPLEQVTKTLQDLHITQVDYTEYSSVDLLVQVFMSDEIEIKVAFCSCAAEQAALLVENLFQEKLEKICSFRNDRAKGDEKSDGQRKRLPSG